MLLDVTAFYAFEQVWDAKVLEISAQRRKVEECRKNGKEIPKLETIDFKVLNLLTKQVERISEQKTGEEIFELFKNMPNKERSIQQHKEYFEYAMINARYLNKDPKAEIGKIVRDNGR